MPSQMRPLAARLRQMGFYFLGENRVNLWQLQQVGTITRVHQSYLARFFYPVTKSFA